MYRVGFPLWLKLGLLFGGVVAGAIAAYGLFDFQQEAKLQRAERRGSLEDLAASLSGGIDGDVHRTFSRARDAARPEFREVHDWLLEVEEAVEDVYFVATSTRDERGHWAYVIDPDEGQPFPVGFPIFDGETERNQAWDGATVFAGGLEDEFGRWDSVFAPIHDDAGAVVGVVELTVDADISRSFAVEARRQVATQIVLAMLISLLTAALFSRYLSRHLAELVTAARAVAGGDLERRVDISTNDELGLLGRTFNEMVDGLQEREYIRDTFGRFVNPDVVEQVLATRGGLRLGGEEREVTVVMSDLRGFTSLSEELGPERMVALLNRYLSRMTQVVAAHDGNVAELMGDGIVTFFGAPIARPDDPRRALRCAIAMQVALQAFNEEEGRELQMGIGIDTGRVIAGNIGSEQHMKYGVVGDTINLAARLEGFTLGNQVLVSGSVLEAAGEGIETDPPFEVHAKGKKRALRCHPLRAVDGLTMPEDVEQERIEVQLTGRLWPVEGKEVSTTAIPIVVVRMSARTVRLQGRAELPLRSAVKLALTIDKTEVGDLYGTVATVVDGDCVIRLTSVPTTAREQLRAFVEEHTDLSESL